MIVSERTIPTIMIVLQVAAAIGYIPCGDWRRVAYWLAGAVLTTAVTW